MKKNTFVSGLSMMHNYRWYTYLTIFILLLTGCGHAMSNNDTKFDWRATESAPQHYPMEIIKGTFIYKGSTQGLYIPGGGTLDAGWGKPISSHNDGNHERPLPDRLTLTFFSYAEKQFYQGDFKLPYDKILMLFREGVDANPDNPIYDRIMAGIAPGGAVAVWVSGSSRKEVYFSHAEKIDLDPSRAFGLPFKDKLEADEYMEEGLIEDLTPEEIQSIKKDGVPFGLWSRYRNLYDWRLTFSDGYKTDTSNIKFVNGEFIRRWVPLKKDATDIQRPIPKRLSFRAIINNRNILYTVDMDEFETMDAFEKLSTNNQKVYLEFEPRLPREQLRARLYNDKESIELKKFVSKK